MPLLHKKHIRFMKKKYLSNFSIFGDEKRKQYNGKKNKSCGRM